MISLHMKRSDISILDVINILLASTYCGKMQCAGHWSGTSYGSVTWWKQHWVCLEMHRGIWLPYIQLFSWGNSVPDFWITSGIFVMLFSCVGLFKGGFARCFISWAWAKVRSMAVEHYFYMNILNNGKALFNRIVFFWFVFICPLPHMVASFLSQLLRTRIFAVWCLRVKNVEWHKNLPFSVFPLTSPPRKGRKRLNLNTLSARLIYLSYPLAIF